MTSTNIYRYWVAVAGTYKNKDGELCNRRPCAFVYPSETVERAQGKLRELLTARGYEGSAPVVVELDPPQKKSGARVGNDAVLDLLSESRVVFISDSEGNAVKLPKEIQKLLH